jgi:hypothetical protein
MKAHDYARAAESYESAYKHQPEPKWLFLAARAHQRAGDLPKAAALYARFLKDAPEKAAQRPVAKRELASVEASVGHVEIRANGATEITMDGQPIDRSAPLYAAAGSHVIEAKFATGSATESVVTAGGQAATVTLEPPPAPEAPVAASPSAAGEQPAPPRTREKPFRPIVVWIGAGATVALGGLTLYSGLDTLSHKDTFVNNRTQENLDIGKGKELRTNILLAFTGAAAVFTVVAAVWLVDWKGKGGQKAQLGVSPLGIFGTATF